MKKLRCSYEAAELGYDSKWNGSESSLVFG